ncbi:hypothetical protein NKI86_30980 [Mesorhizobium sp. M0320]|uniref:hypothetical protein n=1 Tax=unclassified Mesorhizobium TaxID=325217 RepID=UPI00333A21DA
MALYVKASGVWGAASAVWVKISSLWTKARQVYVRSSGVWEKMFPIDLVFNGTHEDSTATTVYTHTSIPLVVAPYANRRVIVTTETTDTESAVTVNSMTIGGVAATLLAQVESIFNSGVVYLSMWSALVPTGTTATIVTTYSESVFRDYMSVYTTTNWDGVVGTVASDNNSTGGLTTTVSIGALGAAIAIAGNATNGGIGTATWTGLTQQFSNAPVTNRNHSGATAQAGLTVTCAYSTTPALAALLVVPLNMS